MRIIGGRLRSRKFDAPEGVSTRPTADRAKVALFNMLQGKLADARVLDGFAGSGALSFEAVSRGARSSVMFESNGGAAAMIRRNADRLGISESVDVRLADFFTGIAGINRLTFDIVFLDPPYASGLLEAAIAASEPLLAPGGLVVAEHAGAQAMPETVGPLIKTNSRRYGIAVFSFYQRKGDG